MPAPRRRSALTSRIGTRLELEAQRKEREIIRIYQGAKNSNGRGGAKLIEAHGSLVKTNTAQPVVPDDTVIIFLSKFGQCMSLRGARLLGNEYFRTEAGLVRFFHGEAGRLGIHHGEILSRTRLPGDRYPDVWLTFSDENNPGFGYVWSLPTRYKRPENFNPNYPANIQILNRTLHESRMHLSDVINRLGRGVYIVAACLVAENQIEPMNRIPYNLPRPYKARPARLSSTAMAYAENIFGKTRPRPGSRIRTRFLPRTGRVYKGPPKIRVASVLAQLGRHPNRVNLESKFPLMRANVNRPRLRRIQKILQNPTNFISKLNANQKKEWNGLGAVNKGAFVNRLMNKPANAGPAPWNKVGSYSIKTGNVPIYFRVNNPLRQTTTWYNRNGTEMKSPPANLSGVRSVSYNNWTNNIRYTANAARLQTFNMETNNNLGPKWYAYVKNNR